METDLGSEVLGGRVLVSVVRRNVHEAVDIVFSSSLCNTLNTVDVDIGVGEVPAWPISKPSTRRGGGGRPFPPLTWWDIDGQQGCTQCQNGERFPQSTGCCADRIPKNRHKHAATYSTPARGRTYNENNTTKVTSRLQVPLRHFLTIGNNDRTSLFGYRTVSLNFSSLHLTGFSNIPSRLTI